MILKDILAGESKNIEFKETLPKQSIKYMKSVVAFANSEGGKIIFGVEDSTCKVVGVGNSEEAFKMMDSIASAISDSVKPAIIPDIRIQTVENKNVIIVEIPQGRNRPYHIKSLSVIGGTYIRLGATNQQADERVIKELTLEGTNQSYDRMLCIGLKATTKEINRLCKTLKQTAINNCISDSQKKSVKTVNLNQLLSWGVLIENLGKYQPSNAYALLTGAYNIPTMIQCAVFKGNSKGIFIDKREFAGPIQEQLEEAYKFVLRNIRLGAVIEGLYRKDIYELPPDAIRELITNAVVHRSYVDISSNIQIALYDNRLEITSPGRLPAGQQIERMQDGYSKIRNEAIALAFSYMNLIESWGSGFPKINKLLQAYGLEPLEIQYSGNDLRISLYRKNVTQGVEDVTQDMRNVTQGVNSVLQESENVTQDVTQEMRNVTQCDNSVRQESKNVTQTQKHNKRKCNSKKNGIFKKIIELIMENNKISSDKIAEKIGVTSRTIKRYLKEMPNVKYIGSGYSGHWEILD